MYGFSLHGSVVVLCVGCRGLLTACGGLPPLTLIVRLGASQCILHYCVSIRHVYSCIPPGSPSQQRIEEVEHRGVQVRRVTLHHTKHRTLPKQSIQVPSSSRIHWASICGKPRIATARAGQLASRTGARVPASVRLALLGARNGFRAINPVVRHHRPTIVPEKPRNRRALWLIGLILGQVLC